MTDKIKLLEEIIESCTDRYGDNRNEIAKALFLLNEIKEAINYTHCSLQLKDYSEQTFEDWLRVNKYTYCSYRMYKNEDNDFISQAELERHYKKEKNL